MNLKPLFTTALFAMVVPSAFAQYHEGLRDRSLKGTSERLNKLCQSLKGTLGQGPQDCRPGSQGDVDGNGRLEKYDMRYIFDNCVRQTGKIVLAEQGRTEPRSEKDLKEFASWLSEDYRNLVAFHNSDKTFPTDSGRMSTLKGNREFSELYPQYVQAYQAWRSSMANHLRYERPDAWRKTPIDRQVETVRAHAELMMTIAPRTPVDQTNQGAWNYIRSMGDSARILAESFAKGDIANVKKRVNDLNKELDRVEALMDNNPWAFDERFEVSYWTLEGDVESLIYLVNNYVASEPEPRPVLSREVLIQSFCRNIPDIRNAGRCDQSNLQRMYDTDAGRKLHNSRVGPEDRIVELVAFEKADSSEGPCIGERDVGRAPTIRFDHRDGSVTVTGGCRAILTLKVIDREPFFN